MRTRTQGVRAADNGGKVVDKQYRGTRIYARLGNISQDEAEAWLRSEQQRIDRERGQGPRHNFCDAAERYLEEKGRENADRQEYVASHLKLILPLIGNKPLEAIHSGTLQAFIDARLAPIKKASGNVKVVSPTTVNKTLGKR